MSVGGGGSAAGRSVASHLRVLRAVGFCRAARPTRPAHSAHSAHRALSAVAARAHAAYCTLALAATTVYLAQECVYAYQIKHFVVLYGMSSLNVFMSKRLKLRRLLTEIISLCPIDKEAHVQEKIHTERSDMDKLARVMFLLLCHVTSISKQLVFYVEADKIDDMILEFDSAAYNPPGEMERALLRETSSTARRLLYVYSGTAVVTCTLWIIFPIMYFVQGLPVEFAFWINVDYSQPSMFVAILIYSYYVTTLVGIANTTMDAFMGTVLYQCKTQLRILRLNFETLTQRAQEVAKNDPNASYETVLMRLFLNCLDHYKRIFETTRRLQDLFGIAILIQFGIGGWILCMAAYKLVSLNVLSVEFASMTLFITCILTELFLYCYYGNEVTVESERVLQSLYGMEWLHTPLRFKRSLLLTMERAQRPLRPAAGRIIPLSLDTFVTILKSSYTFYAVLRQTKQ